MTDPQPTLAQADSDYEIALEFATWMRVICGTLLNNSQREICIARAGWLEEIADRAEKYKEQASELEAARQLRASLRGTADIDETVMAAIDRYDKATAPRGETRGE